MFVAPLTIPPPLYRERRWGVYREGLSEGLTRRPEGISQSTEFTEIFPKSGQKWSTAFRDVVTLHSKGQAAPQSQNIKVMRKITTIVIHCDGIIWICQETGSCHCCHAEIFKRTCSFLFILASRWFFQSLRLVKAAEPSGKRQSRALWRRERITRISCRVVRRWSCCFCIRGRYLSSS